MNLFVADASTPYLYRGIIRNGKTELELTPVPRDRDDYIRIPAEFKPDALILGNGPGSFTGIRSLFSYARSYAMIQQIPIFTFSSLSLWHSLLSLNKDEILFLKVNRNIFYSYDPLLPDAHGTITASNSAAPSNRKTSCFTKSFRGDQNCPFESVTIRDLPKTISYIPALPTAAEIQSTGENWQYTGINYGHELMFLPKELQHDRNHP